MKDLNKLATDEQIAQVISELKKHNIDADVVNTKEEARLKALEMIPKGSEVMTMTSVTLDETGIAEAINNSTDYKSVKNQLSSMDRATQHFEMQKLGAAAEWSIGSVHAVTLKGDVVVASNSGSQLPGYVYGSKYVLWIVGTNKIVQNVEEGIERIYVHTLPLESKRVQKAYGLPHSFVSKIVIFYNEPHQNRIKMILVKEELGY
jgi:hypothetical protein